MTNGLEFYSACWCAGTGCGGHLKLNAAMSPVNFTPIGWQGAAQHTYTPACDGLHGPGACPDFYRQEAPEWGGCTDPGQFDVIARSG